MKSLPWILAVVALAVVVGVWQLLEEPTEGVGDGATVVVGREGPASSAPAVPALPEASGDTSTVQPIAVEPDLPEVEETAGSALPERYRKALGGLIGRVVEEDGTPVPDFEVALAAGGLSTVPLAFDAPFTGDVDIEPILASSRTDGEGRFRLAGVPTRVLGVLLLDPGGPRAGMHFLEESPVSAQERDLGDIVLPGSVTYRGRVLDERREPIAGVRVRATNIPMISMASGVADFREGGGFLVDTGDPSLGFFTYTPPASMARLERMLPIPTTHTDSDGAFELAGVPVGIVTLLLDDNVHMTYVSSPSPSGAAGGVREMGDLVMGDGSTMRGLVVDESGEPVAGAEVMAGNTMAIAPLTILRPPVVTGDDGRFEIPGLKPANAHAVARAEGRDKFTPSAAVVPGEIETRIVLPGGRRFVLSVVDPDGEPVPGASFMGRSVPDDDIDDMPDFIFQPRRLDGFVETDEFGRYVFTDLDAGLWDILVRAPGFGVVREAYDLRQADAEAELVLEPGLPLTVRVLTTDEEAEPLPHAMVMVFDADENDRPLSSKRTGEDGRAHFDDVVAGEYRVEAEFPGLAIEKTVVTLPQEEPADVVLALRSGGRVIGTVVDNGEPPVDILMVTLTHEGDVAAGDEMPRMTLTAPDGSFAFSNVPAGDVELSARERIDLTNLTTWWEPFAMTAMAEADAFVTADQETEVVLLVGNTTDGIPTGSVDGRLIVNGRPAAGWKVRTWGAIRRSVSTDAGGRFNMGRLGAGDVTLLFAPQGHNGMMGAGGAVETYSFELAENGHEFVDLSLATGEVSGRVISDLDGRPIVGATVQLVGRVEESQRNWWATRRSVAVTDQLGEFEFTPVAEGDYTVSAEAEGLAEAGSGEFHVSGSRSVDGILLRMSEGLRFAGVVGFDSSLDLEGRTPRWMWLTAESDTGAEAAARPDPDQGYRFVFDDLSPGTWTFTLYSDLGNEMAPVEVSIYQPTDDAVLVFREAEDDGDDEQVIQLSDG